MKPLSFSSMSALFSHASRDLVNAPRSTNSDVGPAKHVHGVAATVPGRR
jgi:hypothetical protein